MSAGLIGMTSVIRRGHCFSELAVAKSYSAGPVDFDCILVVLPDLDDLARLVTASWRIPCLVLNADAVPNLQWGHFLCVR